MMEIIPPEIIYCPNCKSEIRIDYSGKEYRGTKWAHTSNLLALRAKIPRTIYPEKLKKANRFESDKDFQERGYIACYLIICRSCQMIINAGVP
ncbi:MAG: hypothetical protein ACFFD4_03910 [Candidatus Odinarchaeota archaeon]